MKNYSILFITILIPLISGVKAADQSALIIDVVSEAYRSLYPISSKPISEPIKGASYFVIHTPRYCMKYKGDYRWRLCIKPCSGTLYAGCYACTFCDHNQLEGLDCHLYSYITYLLQDGYIVVAYYSENNEIILLEQIQDPIKNLSSGIKDEEYYHSGIKDAAYYHAYPESSELDIARWVKKQLEPSTKLDSTCKPKAHHAQIGFYPKKGDCLSIFDKDDNCLHANTKYSGPTDSIPNEYIKKLGKYIDFSEMKYIEDRSLVKNAVG